MSADMSHRIRHASHVCHDSQAGVILVLERLEQVTLFFTFVTPLADAC